jgi:diketogulonate reductase-like aldo/keto reductase
LIPQIGLGLWQVQDKAAFQAAFQAAIAAGYRHFDSAQAYGNEQYLGGAIKHSAVARNKLFITTKIAAQHFGYNRTHRTFSQSLAKLQTDYVDLLLLHFPVPFLRQKSWRALEEIQQAGGAKHIGVSNYTIRHLEAMKRYAAVMPAVNQVEQHVFLQEPALTDYCRDNNIVVEAYSPLAHAQDMDDGTIRALATKYGKSYAQIMLRWCIQHDFVVLPKSVTPSRIQENIGIFDFTLDAEDLQRLAARNRNLRTCGPTRSAHWMP